MSENILEMINIVKEFPGVRALDNVNLKVKQGEIHALCGENGAGKSTLMNILCGVYGHGTYTGKIMFQGKECKFNNIKDSENTGISIIHQELAVVPYLTIAENMYIGNERATKGIIDWNKTQTECKKWLAKVNLKESPSTLVKDIGVGKQQLLEIAKALAKNCTLLILDEPTSALNEEDSENLLKLLLELKATGITSIIISHKLNEITTVADSITVIRDGTSIETIVDKSEISEDRIIKGMVGRDLNNRFPERVPNIKEVGFEIKNWTVYDPLVEGRKKVDNVNINVRRGEIVGIAGLMGAGRTELAMSIFGRAYGKNISGRIIKNGKEIQVKNIKDAIKNGLAYVTEDRKSAGLVLIDDIKRNIVLPSLEKISNLNVINSNEEVLIANDFKGKMNIKASSISQKVGQLSGGNQQKVILSKWIYADPDVLILDEPTRGIDIGAKYEIYSIINDLANSGKVVIMISSEMPELLGVCDRIYVMNQGAIVGELDKEEASQESIMKCIMQNIKEVV